MEYQGYIAKVAFDDEAGIFHGEVKSTRDVIVYHGRLYAPDEPYHGEPFTLNMAVEISDRTEERARAVMSQLQRGWNPP
jgi:hypothetical protein